MGAVRTEFLFAITKILVEKRSVSVKAGFHIGFNLLGAIVLATNRTASDAQVVRLASRRQR
jgi:hypothetical protein